MHLEDPAVKWLAIAFVVSCAFLAISLIYSIIRDCILDIRENWLKRK